MQKEKFNHLIYGLAILATAALTACGGGDSAEPKTAVSVASPQVLKQADFNAPGPQAPTSLEGLTPSQDSSSTPVPRKLAFVIPDAGYVVDTMNREQVQLFYKTVFASSEGVPSGWNGDVKNCNAGDTTPEYKDAVLRRINWYRAMAGVPAAVKFDAGFNAKAQQAAMMMSANNQLSHYPPATWSCYNGIGAEAASKSNLSLGSSGKDAVSGQVNDNGANNTAVGHRRWLLYPQTKVMGTGDVAGIGSNLSSNAIWVFDDNYFGPRPRVRDDYVAWPSRGYNPYTTVAPRWSFSYPKADFSSARVSMTENGSAIAAKLETVSNNIGENTLVWLPGSYVDGMSWSRPTADTVYQVTVNDVLIAGQKRSFSYAVTVFDPDQEIPGANKLALTGSNNAVVGQASSYSFTPIAGATDYQWRSFTAEPLKFNDGAEAGAINFTASTSPDYPVVVTDVSATGGKSFHLALTQFRDQTLQLKSVFIGAPNSVIKFNSRLGLATTDQVAKLEASVDGGNTWQDLYQQYGSGSTSPESSFTGKQVSLAQFSNRLFQLRFNYGVKKAPSVSFYNMSSKGVGWYIDDIQIDGVEVQTSVGQPAETGANDFSLLPSSPGGIYLQMRPGSYGFYGDWGVLKSVSVQTVVDTRDCIMNWAERTYPGTFSTSPSVVSQYNAVYYFRYYTTNQSAIGFSNENSVHYLAPGTDTAVNIGSKAQWMSNSGCK